MSELWICSGQTAQKPFRLEPSGAEISTVEELCFYLYQNINHLEEEILDESLLSWLDQELQWTKLADSLRRELRQGRDVLYCIWLLLREVGMYSGEELSEIREICFAMDQKDEFECRKLKADRLFHRQKYRRCIGEYRRLLESEDEKQPGQQHDPKLMGDILHNLGSAYAGLFLYQEAAECFQKAYEKNGRQESLQAYEDAVCLKDQEFRLPAEETESDSGTQPESENQDLEKRVQELKEEYRRNGM